MKKKNNTRGIIIVMVVLTIVISVVLAAINIMAAQLDDGPQDVTSQREWARISDEIQYMADSADLYVQYFNSSQRVGVYFVGRERYYQLQYNSEARRLYICEGTYTSSATTDEIKISEATHGSTGLQPYADNILSFVVNGADSNGAFPSGEMNATLRVEVGGVNYGKDFTVTLPEKAE